VLGSAKSPQNLSEIIESLSILINMSKNLVIVESPAKAKNYREISRSDFKVLSSVGHIRSIAKKTKDVTPRSMLRNVVTVLKHHE
jgi:hypothetical protein